VVLNHATSWAFIGMFWWTHRYRDVTVPNFDQLGSLSYYTIRVIEQLVAFTVPSFLFVSGFFIAFVGDRSSLSSMWLGAWNRLRTLLLPYLIWSTVMLIERMTEGFRPTLGQTMNIYLMGRAAEPYYYIPVLCQCLLLAPLLIALGKNHWRSVLAAAALLHLMVEGWHYAQLLGVQSPWLSAMAPLTNVWLFPGKLVFFALGVVVSLHLEEAQGFLQKYRSLWLALAVAFIPLGVLEWELLRTNSPDQWLSYFDTLADSFYAVAVLAFAITFTAKVPMSDGIQDVGKYSYGIYLTHAIVLGLAARVVYHVAPWLLGLSLFFYLFLVVIGLGIPLTAMRLMKTSTLRGGYRFVFG
jgi:fucose 4-O-acetylase-like acetyltransferase